MPCRFDFAQLLFPLDGRYRTPLNAASKSTPLGLRRARVPQSGSSRARRAVNLLFRIASRSPSGLRRAILACFISTLCGAIADASTGDIRGLPFSRVYSLEEIGYVPRGSRLRFDSFGRVAVINEGVYAVLNDTAWLNLAVDPEQTAPLPMCDVALAEDGQTYYCGRASWGVAEFGGDGKLHAKSLVPANPPAWTRNATFDNLISTADGVYFASRFGVVFWSFARNEAQIYEHPNVTKIFPVGQKVFISAFGDSLSFIDVAEHAIKRVPGDILDGRRVVQAVALDKTRALLSFPDGAPVVFDGTTASPWNGADNFSGRISAIERLSDGEVALAITGKGVFIIAADGKLRSSLTTPQYHRVSSIASREPGVLWLLNEDSIEKVLYRGGLTSFGGKVGLPVAWPLVARWNDRLFVATVSVLYEAISSNPAEVTRFEPLDRQPPGGVWSIAASGRHMLVGSRTEIFSPELNGSWKSVARLSGLRHLVMVSENVCYAIGHSEIALLEWNGERWTEGAPRIAGLRNPALAHRGGQSVWVEMAGDGVARIFRKDGSLQKTVLQNEPWTKANWVNIGVVNDTVVLSPVHEQRRFFDEKTGDWRERPDLQQLLNRAPRTINRVWSDAAGTLWATSSEGLVRFTPKGTGYDMDLSSFDFINDRYPLIHILDGTDIWVSAGRSLHHVEPGTSPPQDSPPEPVLVSLIDTNRNLELLGSRVQRSAPVRIPFSQNSLAFQFFSGSYAWRRAPVYEFRLNAADPWARLDTGSVLRFPSLHEGDYQLQVRIVGARGGLAEPTGFAFEIHPPWYRTLPAYIVYASLALLATYGVARWSTYLAHRRNRALEQLVRDRTRELESAMRKLNEETRTSATLAERDRLAGEIHDSVQQGLSGAIIQLDTTLTLPAITAALRARLNVVRNMVSYARQEVQHAVWDMHSPLLESNDLGEALSKLATFTASSDLVPTVTINGGPARQLPRTTTHHLLRIAQEATTNAIRHAGARRIGIELTFESDRVELTVSDDGIGFCSDDVLNKSGHFGLRGIRGRVNKLQGELQIESSPGLGTSISVHVPLTPQNHGRRRPQVSHLA